MKRTDGQDRDKQAHPPAFRAEAVELVRTSGKNVLQIARELGISDQALRDWIKRAAIDAGQGPAGAPTTSEREELRRLRRENQFLRQEREILTPRGHPAVAFFAKETS